MNRNLSPGPPPTPELDRRSLVLDQSHVIGEFLDWLTTRGVILSEMRVDLTDTRVCLPCNGTGLVRGKEHSTCLGTGHVEITLSPKLMPIHPDIEQLLADFFEIDLTKIEAERRQILEHLRDVS